jgi:hypothetical protein
MINSQKFKSKYDFPILYYDFNSLLRIIFLSLVLMFFLLLTIIDPGFFEISKYMFILVVLPIFFAIKDYYLIFHLYIIEEIKYDTEINNFLLLFKHKFKSDKITLNLKDILEIEKTKISKRHLLSNLSRVQSIYIYTKSETYVIFYNNEQVKEIDEIYNDLTQMLDNFTKTK